MGFRRGWCFDVSGIELEIAFVHRSNLISVKCLRPETDTQGVGDTPYFIKSPANIYLFKVN